MHNRAVVELEHLGELLDARIRETVFAEVQLCELRVLLDDLADYVHSLISKRHLGQIELTSALDSIILHDHVEEAQHLLLGRVYHQVLALGHV